MRNNEWPTSTGDDRYRRGIYTFWRRTIPYPTFVNFDATSREVCTIRRGRTNTPLQSLNMLNDRAFFEAAQALARRAAGEGGTSARGRVTRAFRLCVARHPTDGELRRLLALYERLLGRFADDEGVGDAIGGAGLPPRTSVRELAALTMVANALLNLDETQTKE